ncbi:MAG: TPM domain-containing protein [Nitrospirota bacterium]
MPSLSSSSLNKFDKVGSKKCEVGSKEVLFLTFCLLLLISCFSLAFAATPEPPAVPSNYVVDLANIINDNAEAQLNGYLRELEQKTTAQFVILTIDSLDGEDIEGFSITMAEKWKLGQKGKDNGVLMTVALKDRRYRIEVGYGLESILPDSLVGSIGRGYIVPYFRKGDYSRGVITATLVIINTIATHEGVEITGMPRVERGYGRKAYKIGPVQSILLFIALIAVIILFIKHPGLFLLLFLSSGRRGGGWHGSGGFGGGGFGGGFGGGGGGGFGGGGASGNW